MVGWWLVVGRVVVFVVPCIATNVFLVVLAVGGKALGRALGRALGKALGRTVDFGGFWMDYWILCWIDFDGDLMEFY